jgi:ribosomal RNA-processing protein 8
MGKNDGDDVIICDMSELPISDGSVHIGVFSLSLMGSNYKDYLKEAKRVIVTGGRLFIAEPYNRWENRENGIDELRLELESEGFDVIGNIITTESFIYVDAINSI